MDITLSEDIDAEYLEDVADILTNKEFLALNSYRHHVATTRLMHSINVSYISWLTAKKLGCDTQAAARAGLLHDFFLYDPRESRPSRELQAFCHPKVAARTSGETFKISEKERDAILSHMFPLGPLPKSREAWIISGADKICACAEVFHITIALARDGRVAVSPA